MESFANKKNEVEKEKTCDWIFPNNHYKRGKKCIFFGRIKIENKTATLEEAPKVEEDWGE